VDGNGPIHTDRDHRIKIQFHWQRGAHSSHRLSHPSGACNAPGSEASGSWVRVASRMAGANWGAVQVPRVGQEVLVGFAGGQVDRPVVLASLYNAQGQANAQEAQPASGAAHSSGNAPPWFPGSLRQGELQAHAHAAVLNGIKSQELSHSASGQGGYNQLVLDDTPGQSRVELSSTQAHSRLLLGQLRHQDDNRRLNPKGHGFELRTDALGAVRGGAGLLLSSHAYSARNACIAGATRPCPVSANADSSNDRPSSPSSDTSSRTTVCDGAGSRGNKATPCMRCCAPRGSTSAGCFEASSAWACKCFVCSSRSCEPGWPPGPLLNSVPPRHVELRAVHGG